MATTSSASALSPQTAHGRPAAAKSSLPTGAVHPIAPARLSGIKGRPDAVTVGIIVWLASELMFFAALFACYFTIRNVTGTTAQEMWHRSTEMLNVPYAFANTCILVASSVTCQMGVFAAEHGRVRSSGSAFNPAKWGMREWYILTFVLGAIFVSGQVWEYANLLHEGLAIYTNVYGSLFFLATGFHGLHVTGGLVAFLLLLGRTYVAKTFTHEQAVNAIAVSYYWHFVDVVWLILFATIYFIK